MAGQSYCMMAPAAVAELPRSKAADSEASEEPSEGALPMQWMGHNRSGAPVGLTAVPGAVVEVVAP